MSDSQLINNLIKFFSLISIFYHLTLMHKRLDSPPLLSAIIIMLFDKGVCSDEGFDKIVLACVIAVFVSALFSVKVPFLAHTILSMSIQYVILSLKKLKEVMNRPIKF